jgi:hypothetical protein
MQMVVRLSALRAGRPLPPGTVLVHLIVMGIIVLGPFHILGRVYRPDLWLSIRRNTGRSNGTVVAVALLSLTDRYTSYNPILVNSTKSIAHFV